MGGAWIQSNFNKSPMCRRSGRGNPLSFTRTSNRMRTQAQSSGNVAHTVLDDDPPSRIPQFLGQTMSTHLLLTPGSKLLSQQIQIRRGKHRWFHIRQPPSHPPHASVPHACRKDTNVLVEA